MDSILNSIKQLLGIPTDSETFDPNIIMHINSAIFTLTQIGVGPSTGYRISNKFDTYFDFLGEDTKRLSIVSIYLYDRVKLGFDPPTNATVVSLMTEEIKEIEWRLRTEMEQGNMLPTEDNENGDDFQNGCE